MPYTMDTLPDAVTKLPKGKQEQWLAVFNSAFDSCMKDGGKDGDCEESSFAQAWGVVKEDEEKTKAQEILEGLRWLISRLFPGHADQAERAQSIDSMFWMAVEKIEGDDYDSFMNNLYFDEDGSLFAIVSKEGKLYRCAVTYANGELTVGEMTEVMLDFPEKRNRSTTIIRQADGVYRWFSISCSAVLDRVGEIDSRELFDSFVQHFEETGEQPIRLYYHLGEQFRTGICDFVGRDDNLLITSGTYDDTELARAEIAARQADPDYWGDSIGYNATDKPEMLEVMDGVSIPVWRAGILKEISTLPENDAAAWFTATPTIQKEVNRMLGDNQMQAFIKLFNGDEDAAKKWLEENAANRNRAIQDAGMITRDAGGNGAGGGDPAPEPEPVEPTEPVPDAEPVTPEVALDEAVITEVSRQAVEAVMASEVFQGVLTQNETLRAGQDAIQATLTELRALVEGFDGRLKLFEATDEEKRARWQADLPAASRAQVNVTYRPRQGAAVNEPTAPVIPNSGDVAAETLERIPVKY